MIRRITRTAFATTAGVLLALAFVAGPLHADIGGPGAESWTKLLNYAGCALGIAAAASGFGVAAAIVACVKILVLEV
jgi:hypothetical protein